MSRYEKTFHSRSGEEFRADVYAVLVAFSVTCPARQHAIKKLLMPGQRGSKGEVQDLDEALWSVSRAVDMACARRRDGHGASDVRETRSGGTLTGETEPEHKPEPKPKLVVWRRCVPVEHSLWIESGQIPDGWVALESHTQPVETIQQLPEGQKP